MRVAAPEPGEDLDADLDAATAGDGVEDDRAVGGVGDGAEMPEESLLRRAVVVGGDDEEGVGARGDGGGGEVHGLAGRVGAGAGDHRHAAARVLDHAANDLEVLAVVHGGRFAGGADGHEAVDAGLDLEVHQAAEFVVGDRAGAERRGAGGDGAGEPAGGLRTGGLHGKFA